MALASFHRSEIIPYFGAGASSTNKGQVFFLHRAPLPPLPPFRRGIRVRNGKRQCNVRTFFLPSALFPLYAARITSILGLALYALFFENVRRIYENLVSSRVVLPKFPPPTRLRKGEKRKNDRGIIVIRVTINHFHHFQSSVRSLLEHSFGC